VTKTPAAREPRRASDANDVRERVLDAAFAAFMKHGFATASTLEIATAARVSKRELYALVGNKEQILFECISSRARRMQLPADLPLPRDRNALLGALTALGTQIVRELTDPAVVAVFRLAIAEAVRAPEVARILDTAGRETVRRALRQFMTHARESRLLDGNPAELAEQFGGLLWGNLLVGLLLGVMERPSPNQIAKRACEASTAFLQMYSRTSQGEATGRRRGPV